MADTNRVNFIRRQPVATAAALVTLFTGVVTVLSMFDVWRPTRDQIDAITGLITIAVPVLATLVWGQVTPVADPDPAVVASSRSVADLDDALARARTAAAADVVQALARSDLTVVAPVAPPPAPAPPDPLPVTPGVPSNRAGAGLIPEAAP